MRGRRFAFALCLVMLLVVGLGALAPSSEVHEAETSDVAAAIRTEAAVADAAVLARDDALKRRFDQRTERLRPLLVVALFAAAVAAARRRPGWATTLPSHTSTSIATCRFSVARRGPPVLQLG